MSIQVSCDSCFATFRVNDRYAGKTGRCPECKERVTVPLADDPDDPWEEELPPMPAVPAPRSAAATRAPARSNSKRTMLLIGGIAGGIVVVMLVIGGFGLYRAVRRARIAAKIAARHGRGAAGQLPGRLGGQASGPGSLVEGPAPTDEECRKFAGKVADAVRDKNRASFAALINVDALLNRATKGFESDRKARQVRSGFIRGVKSSMATRRGVVGAIIQAVSNGGSYTFLRVRDVAAKKRVQFRIVTKEGALNYHEMVVERRPSGNVQAVDMYIVATGQLLSQTLRDAFLPMVEHASRGILARLTGSESDFVKHISTMNKMVTSIKLGQHAEAVRLYGTLPPSMQKRKNVLMLRLTAAQKLGDTAYLTAINDFRRYFPNDPAVDLLSIDGFIIQKQFAKAMASIDRLDHAIGGDLYLNIFRSNIFVQQQQFSRARAVLQAAVDKDPTLKAAHIGMLMLSLQLKDFDQTVKSLKMLREKCGTEIPNMALKPDFAGFVKSPQYKKWRATRPKT